MAKAFTWVWHIIFPDRITYTEDSRQAAAGDQREDSLICNLRRRCAKHQPTAADYAKWTIRAIERASKLARKRASYSAKASILRQYSCNVRHGGVTVVVFQWWLRLGQRSSINLVINRFVSPCTSRVTNWVNEQSDGNQLQVRSIYACTVDVDDWRLTAEGNEPLFDWANECMKQSTDLRSAESMQNADARFHDKTNGKIDAAVAGAFGESAWLGQLNDFDSIGQSRLQFQR